MMPVGRVILLFTVFFAPSAPAFAQTSDFLDRAFEPFRDLDFVAFYDDYSSIIDIVIHVALSTALAHATIGRRFPGRSGKVVAAVLRIEEASE